MVLLHSSYLLDDVSGDIPIQMAVTSIAGIGLPLYFFLSAYFFTIGYSIENMDRKIISRIKKIAIPYVLWQFIMIKGYHILGRLDRNRLGIRFIDETYFPSGIKETFKFIYKGWRDPPLWYLLVLIQFVFITPVLLMLVKKFRYVSLLAISMIILINVGYYGDIPYASLPYWAPEYLSGIWMAIYAPDVVRDDKWKKLGGGGVRSGWYILFLDRLLYFVKKRELYSI